MCITTCGHDDNGVRCHQDATVTIDGSIFCGQHAPMGSVPFSHNPVLDEIAAAFA